MSVSAHESAEGQGRGVYLLGADEARDLTTLLTRVRSTDAQAAVRVQSFGPVLAVWVPVITPQGLMDPAPTVLGLRTLQLAQPSDLDITVLASAFMDRLARWSSQQESSAAASQAGTPVWLAAPPQEIQAAWAGVLPPRTGWELAGSVAASALKTAAEKGINRVADSVPTDSGAAIVHKVRSQVWGEPLAETDPLVANVPAGAAFGLDVLGFLPAHVHEVSVAHAGPWHRLTTPAGHVLARTVNPAT